MSAKLVAEEGALKGLVLSLEGGDEWVIGRDPDACQLLVEDPSASRKHLVCRVSPEGIVVENLSQTNPIEVNEEEVKEPRLLHNGDAVKIGDGVFRFYADAAAHLFKETNSTSDEPMITSQSPLSESNPQPENEPSMENAKEQNEEVVNNNLESALDEAAAESAKDSTAKNTSDDDREDTIYDEEAIEKGGIAEINFGLLDTGRWLLKVITGPNNGAEFSMQTGSSYVIGTDPNVCDIVFHDTSVSRQHARVTVAQDDTLSIEDLNSRNGTIVDGEKLTGKRALPTNMIVNLGTTSFVVFDREGEMHTIISPLMPSIVKVLQKDEVKKEPEVDEAAAKAAAMAATIQAAAEATKAQTNQHTTMGAFILIGILTGVFIIVGIGTATLFRSEPVTITEAINPTQMLDSALSAFPSVKYTFNKNTGQLLLVGHVSTATDRSQLLYALRGMNFIHNLDDSGLVIDEFVWREINQVMEKNPDWKGISVISTEPGEFAITGFLKTRAQAERLSEYLSTNFQYPDLLENRVVIEEDVLATAASILQSHGLKSINVKLNNGELTLTGGIPQGKDNDLAVSIEEIKGIKGVRTIRNATSGMASKEAYINISDKYEVSGVSEHAGKMSVVINGRILMKGDTLDGMTVITILPHSIHLEKDGTQYRIDFNH